jgi:hypothetical protein
MPRKPRQRSARPSSTRRTPQVDAAGASVRPIATEARDLDDLGHCAWCDGRLSLSFVILSLFGEPVGPPYVIADPSVDALVPAGDRLLAALPVEPDLDTNPHAGYDLAISVCSSRCADAVQKALDTEWRRRVH